MVEVDVRGLSCPIPVVKVKKAMEEHPGEALAVLVEAEVSRENVARLAGNQRYGIAVEGIETGATRMILTPANKQ
jgi:tRNA 2-thiouridine synthesizing protein A